MQIWQQQQHKLGTEKGNRSAVAAEMVCQHTHQQSSMRVNRREAKERMQFVCQGWKKRATSKAQGDDLLRARQCVCRAGSNQVHYLVKQGQEHGGLGGGGGPVGAQHCVQGSVETLRNGGLRTVRQAARAKILLADFHVRCFLSRQD
eukprot:1159846-Pelagomonas_calceolata.AAC.10